MPNQVAITGANAAVGRALIVEAERAGVAWVACVRSERARGELPERARSGPVHIVDYADPRGLERAFMGVTSVVHLPGLLIERPGSSYVQANVDPTRAMVEAARAAGVVKIVLVSAVGARADSTNRYYATKGAAEDCVRSSGVEFTILRAPLVLGPGTEGEAAIRRYVRARTPRLLAGGSWLQQPIDVRDLARGVLASTRMGVAAGKTLEVVGPEAVTYRGLVERTAQLAGSEVAVGAQPLPVGCLYRLLQLRALLLAPVLGPGFSADALEVILDEHVFDPGPACEALGIELTPLDDTLRAIMKDASRHE